MRNWIILGIILIATILGVGLATNYLAAPPAPAAPITLTAVPTPTGPSAPVAAPPMNQNSALAPPPETVFITDGKHSIALRSFSIYKNPAEDSQELVGDIQYGMVIEVLETRKDCLAPQAPDVYVGFSLTCYKVKKDGKEGWVVDRGVLSPKVPVPTSALGDLSWLFQRFGESTWYYEEAMNETSFTNEEYEKLILAANAGYEPAQVALRLTLVKSLEKNPVDPKLAGFKDKVKSLQY